MSLLRLFHFWDNRTNVLKGAPTWCWCVQGSKVTTSSGSHEPAPKPGICQFTHGQVPWMWTAWRAAAWPVARWNSWQLLICWLPFPSAARGLNAMRTRQYASRHQCLSVSVQSSHQCTDTGWYLFTGRATQRRKEGERRRWRNIWM